MWSPCIPWAHWSHMAGYILNVISICPLGTFYSHNWVHFECIWFLPTGYIVITYWLDSQCIQHVPTDYWGPCPQCKGRYIGPFSLSNLKAEIGPFQSSPLSLVPKLGKPGKFCLIQNLSHLHNNHPTPSINAFLNSDKFSCTWGTFRTMCTLIRSLPPGTQAATRDIAEAYRIIPLHENQWPGVVVQVSNDPEPFALNTSNSFGCATVGWLFGLFGDALADLLCVRGIGPILKWVGNFVFIRIPKETIENYNGWRASDRQTLTLNGGQIQTSVTNWHFSRSFRLIFLNTYDPYLLRSYLIKHNTLVLNHFNCSLCSQMIKSMCIQSHYVVNTTLKLQWTARFQTKQNTSSMVVG